MKFIGIMWLLSIQFLCVTLWHMSICARIVVAVAFEQVNHAPDTKTSTERDNEGLQYSNRLIEKFHITSLSAALCGDKNMIVLCFGQKNSGSLFGYRMRKEIYCVQVGARPQ